jgi:hypothetical protein
MRIFHDPRRNVGFKGIHHGECGGDVGKIKSTTENAEDAEGK